MKSREKAVKVWRNTRCPAIFGGLPRPLTLGEVASRSDDREGKDGRGETPRKFRLHLREGHFKTIDNTFKTGITKTQKVLSRNGGTPYLVSQFVKVLS